MKLSELYFFRRFNHMPKSERIEFIKNFIGISKHQINPDRIWFDINRDEIIQIIKPGTRYDIYIISKRGYIKVIRNKKLVQIIALRFRYYKKYIVIAEVSTESEEKQETTEILAE